MEEWNNRSVGVYCVTRPVNQSTISMACLYSVIKVHSSFISIL